MVPGAPAQFFSTTTIESRAQSALQPIAGVLLSLFGSKAEERSSQLWTPIREACSTCGKTLNGPRRSEHDASDVLVRGWLGDLDSNQDCSVQSREFYR